MSRKNQIDELMVDNQQVRQKHFVIKIYNRWEKRFKGKFFLPNFRFSIIFQFDNKRREVESWLGRMEVWLGQMGPVGSTANVLEAQIREQKVNINSIASIF